ncbi:hypothetical protein CA13_61790 [Planctomycetes bacterium CA13]|uniref:Uncharacterized protein n=1 Tax=Novipirellula herctigrandis TaxID=2527986 RepID=A0A5C5ZBD0_9BACT|nr:hypothetical protein CA13_61790 [Planctomycetes bacterium CA13]
MAICLLQKLLGKRSSRTWLSILFIATLPISSVRAEPNEIEAESWRSEQLAIVAKKIQDADSDDERLEFVARQAWLRRWKPGQMAPALTRSKLKPGLVEEPLLEKLKRPTDVAPNAWQQMTSSQTELIAIDTDEDRKENLRTIIGSARQLENVLSEQLPSESQQLPASTAWVLAYTRYRLGRALAYRELPSVQERWPISNPVHYQEQLFAVYQRLIDQTNRVRPEFILLEDRILRRSGKKGRALELLEAHRESIEPKWYLKKRRDLLQELGWEPPYKEAARLYVEAGYGNEL